MQEVGKNQLPISTFQKQNDNFTPSKWMTNMIIAKFKTSKRDETQLRYYTDFNITVRHFVNSGFKPIVKHKKEKIATLVKEIKNDVLFKDGPETLTIYLQPINFEF